MDITSEVICCACGETVYSEGKQCDSCLQIYCEHCYHVHERNQVTTLKMELDTLLICNVSKHGKGV